MTENSNGARAVKRRGILAAAGAAVAGMMAKHAARETSVSANDQIWTMPYLTSTNAGGSLFALTNTGGGSAINVGSSGYAGVLATGSGYHGIYGVCYAAGAYAGVYGQTDSGSSGVWGYSDSKIGVQGTSMASAGVLGQIPATSTAGTIGVFGNNLSTGANSIGVYGSCVTGTGVYGQTSASYQYGILGTTYAANSTAIGGTCVGNGFSAFSGGTGNPNAFAAYFQGHVQVDGPFDVIGLGNKHAAAPHPDGSHRLFYSVEAPEAWVEDVGTGTLVGGKAEIKLDADFAALIHTEEYHVFLTEQGGTHHHLSVAAKTTGGFSVEADGEMARLKGQAASALAGTFSWRVLAKPKTTANVGRLATVTMAEAKALLPDAAKLPKPPVMPPASPPGPPTPGR